MKIRSLLSFAALLAPSIALAEWTDIGTSSNDSVWSVDAQRIKVDAGKVQAWVKIDHSRDKTVQYRKSMRMFSFDCKQSKYRMLSYVNYDSFGKVVSSHTYSDYGYGIGYEPIIPETMVEAVSEVVCILSAAN